MKQKIIIHHNLFITLLMGSKAETVLVKQPCYSQTEMYSSYREMTIYGHFSIYCIQSFFYIIYTFLGSIFKPCYNEQCYKEGVV